MYPLTLIVTDAEGRGFAIAMGAEDYAKALELQGALIDGGAAHCEIRTATGETLAFRRAEVLAS